jgi:hypothetical protein
MQGPLLIDPADKLIDSIREWLTPPPYKDQLLASSSLRDDGTAEWIFNEALFRNWRDDTPVLQNVQSYRGFLWVKGAK